MQINPSENRQQYNESYIANTMSHLEKAANWTPGWMDIDHDAQAVQTGLSRVELELITLFRQVSAERRRLILALTRLKT